MSYSASHLVRRLAAAAGFTLAALLHPAAIAQDTDPEALAVVVMDENSIRAPEELGVLLFPEQAAAMGVLPVDPALAVAEPTGGRRGLGATRGIRVLDPTASAQTLNTEHGAAGAANTPVAASAPAQPQQPAPAPSAIAVPVNFEFDSAQLDPSARALVDQLGAMMNLPEYAAQKLVIEGHTDNKGGLEYNQQLSLRRAVAVGQYLHQVHGIAVDRLVIEAHGESAPLDGYPADHANNRRVQFRAA